jgi:predicted ATPase
MSAVNERYHVLLKAGELRADPDQQRAVAALDRLAIELQTAARPSFGSA